MMEGQSTGPVKLSKAGRVLMVAGYDTSVVQFLLPHVMRIRELGFDIEVAYRPESARASRELQAVGLVCHHVDFGQKPFASSNPRAFGQIKALLQRGRYDIVHVNMPVPGWLSRLAAEIYSPDSLVIYTVHGFHFHPRGGLVPNALFMALEKLAGYWTDVLVTITEEDYYAAVQHHIVDPQRVWHMPGVGVDTEQYDPAKVAEADVRALRQELGLGDKDVLFLMQAGFRPGKRHADALRALALLNNPQVHLAFAGSGPLEARMRELAKALGVDQRTHFLGYRPDVPVVTRASRAAILPSEREGLQHGVLESLALEVPVIGSDIRGIRELLRDGCGILVPVGEPEALVAAMRRMMDEPDEAVQMGRRGRRLACMQYSLDKALKFTERLYRDVWLERRALGRVGRRA